MLTPSPFEVMRSSCPGKPGCAASLPGRCPLWAHGRPRGTWSGPSRPRSGARGRSAGVVAGRLDEAAANPGASAHLARQLEGGADARGPLAHAEDAVGVEAAGLADGEALAVVGDLE